MRARPPQVAGIFWDRSLDASNVASQRQYKGRFTIDAQRGIVQFAEPVMQVNSGSGATGFGEAQLYLTVAHGVKDRSSLQDVRPVYERALPGPVLGTGPKVLRRDDLVRTVSTQYDGGNNPTGTIENTSDLDDEAQSYLDAAEAEFETLETDQVEYAGIVPISPDGAIQQVEWLGGPGGGLTRASRNSEFSIVVPASKERRSAEKGRQRDELALTGASAAALRKIREAGGGR
ncbi:MAG TPA: hypothetical protein VKU82_07355 [Planctomycetaceae bacterium]|nr:hypothetical protein [Planctomycetaceae bacterium]